MPYVFDSSFVGAIIIPDEKNLNIDKTYASIGEDELIYVPQLFWYEISNIFKNLLRRKKYSIDDIMEFFPSLTAIRLISSNESGAEYSQKLLQLCNEYALSSYDAAYLELAKRKNAALCSLDGKLLAAAKKHGVIVKHLI